jgi:nucleotide-binding universal stress UspA family protein
MLPEYQRILYATDLSDNARAVFRHAISFSRAYKAKIYLLHVIPALLFDKREQEMTSFGYASTLLGADLDDDQVAKATAEIVQKIYARIKAFSEEELTLAAEDFDWLGGIEVLVGKSPTAEILKASERLNADLLIFGSHSKGLLKQTFLGSVAESILENSRCPALIIPIV